MCWPLSPRLIGNMDTPSSLVGSLYSRDGIPLQQFQDGHGRCFFFAISGTGATQRSRSPKACSERRDNLRVNVMWQCGCRVNEWFDSTLPFAIRSQKGDASKTGWENSRLSGAGGWGLQNLTHIFLGTLDRSLVSGSKKMTGKRHQVPCGWCWSTRNPHLCTVSRRKKADLAVRSLEWMGRPLTWRIIPGIWRNMDKPNQL